MEKKQKLKLIVKLENKTKELDIRYFPANFGRGTECNYRVDHPSVSREHFTIYKEGQSFIIKDLNSTNGIQIDGDKVSSMALKNNNIIKAGELSFKVEIQDANFNKQDTNHLEEIGNDDFEERRHINIKETSFWEAKDKDSIYDSNNALKTIYEILDSCNNSKDLDQFFDRLFKSLLKTVYATRGSIVLKSSCKDSFYEGDIFRSIEGPVQKFKMSQTVLKDVIENNVSVISFNIKQDKRYIQVSSLQNCNIYTLICVPLVSDNQVFGALYLDRMISSESTSFKSEELDLVYAIGTQIGGTIAKSLLLKKMQVLVKEKDEALKQLKEAQNLLIRKERLLALGEMASSIVHDFGNTLVPISGYSELMILKPEVLDDPNQISEYVQNIYTASKDASSIVNRLKKFYQASSKDSFKIIDINTIVEETIALSAPRWKNSSIEVKTDLDSLPKTMANEYELREALMNIILNAVDAMPEGGIITLRTTFTNEPGNETHGPSSKKQFHTYLLITISDTGVGMTPEVYKKCFDPFFTTKGEYGTGLGLSSAFGIVKKHQGTMEVKSKEGKGTTFLIKIPLQNLETTTKCKKQNFTQKALSILIVDDNSLVRKVLIEYLKFELHQFEIALNVTEALEKAKKQKYDVVILDEDVEVGQFVQDIKQIHKDVIIIELLGFSKVSTRENVNYFLTKPVALEELQKLLLKCGSKKQ